MTWENYSVGELCLRVTDGSHFSPKEVTEGYPMASSKDMLENDFDYSSIKKISQTDYDKLVKGDCKPLKDDILIIKDGNSYLKYIFAIKDEKDLVVLSSIAILRPNKDLVNPLFFQSLLRAPQTKEAMSNFVSGAAIPRIVLKDFKQMRVSIPPLPTQRKIASILSAYDDLIENNLKRIKLLEESIRTHYKIMMSENDGRWEKQRIDEAYDFSNGYAFYKDGYSEDGNIVIDLGNISESSNLIMTGKEKYVSELLYDDKKKFHLNKYDVIVAMTDMTSRLGILAKVALIDESNKYILNQRVGRLRSKIDYIDHCFVYASLSNEEFRNEMKTKAKGAVQIYFNTKDILEYKVTIPPKKKVQEFSNTISPIIDLRFSLNNQNTKLREARDILLPRLMNGQIEV